MPPENLLAKTLQVLRARRFSAAYSKNKSCRAFEGNLCCSKGEIRIRIEISDWDFRRYPTIILLNRPEFLPKIMAHVDAHDALCYYSPGTVILDRYDPAASVEQCLDQAQAVLEQTATNPHYSANDLQNEFESHWAFGQHPTPEVVLVGNVNAKQSTAEYFLFDLKTESYAAILQNQAEAAQLANTLGAPVPPNTRCKCWLLETENMPAVPHEKMPETVKEVFDWLADWDRKLYNGVQRVLEKEKVYLTYDLVTFAIKSPIGWIGFGFNLDQMTRLGYKEKPARYKQYLHGKGGAGKIFRLSFIDISPSFIHNRNLSFRDLSGKRIALVGCGAIGGYLAQALVRLGAGTGRNGKLVLFDNDRIGSENLGRHYLGLNALFKPKAQALCDELRRQFPYADIEARIADAMPTKSLFSNDLIIDATGEESVSEMLNGHHNLDRAKSPPVLYVWIKGNGECVQSLWVDAEKHGCFRCLRSAHVTNYRDERFKVLDKPPKREFLGCRSFTPYAVSSPMQAAALAIDTISDWLVDGDPSPRFRTRYVENHDAKKVKNQNITPAEGCPACQAP